MPRSSFAIHMTKRFEQHITAEISGITAIELLAEHTCLSRQRLKKAMSNGSVWRESNAGINRTRRVKKPLQAGVNTKSEGIYLPSGTRLSVTACMERKIGKVIYSYVPSIWRSTALRQRRGVSTHCVNTHSQSKTRAQHVATGCQSKNGRVKHSVSGFVLR